MNILNERSLKGTFFGNNKPRTEEKYMNKELQLKKFITHSVPFSEINKAFEYMLQGGDRRPARSIGRRRCLCFLHLQVTLFNGKNKFCPYGAVVDIFSRPKSSKKMCSDSDERPYKIKIRFP
ncbi:alcohol dehydrogenase class-P-like [Syzygium oleosum]|uniref:alcohol dehydrogenase class-P-like n=1 Tax=Syzygium oleosum TaxID=219896 RepID=UPI0024B90778|nr:alcohol dehydrogenase class-P-like [Syzygium oleosum]